jgi:hypothetical protein
MGQGAGLGGSEGRVRVEFVQVEQDLSLSCHLPSSGCL